MIQVRSLFAALTRPEVTEVAIATDRPPCACIDGAFRPFDQAVLTTDEILQLLFAAGGSRHIELLGSTATHWQTRADGVGFIIVSALMHGAVVQARFTLRRDKAQSDAPPSSLSSVALAARAELAASMSAPPPQTKQQVSAPPGKPSYQFGRESMPALKVDLADIETRRPPPGSLLARSASMASKPSPAPSPAPISSRAPSPLSMARSSAKIPIYTNPSQRSKTPTHLPSAISLPPAAMESFAPEDSHGEPISHPSHAISIPPSALGSLAPPTPLPDTMQSISDDAASSSQAIPPPPPPASRRGGPREALTAPGIVMQWGRLGPARAFKDLLTAARKSGTTDVHLIAARPPLMRRSGELVAQGGALDPQLIEEMILPRVPERLRGDLERDGSCDFSLEEPGVGRFRVNVSRQRTGLKASLRLIPEVLPTLASLGLPDAIGAAARHAHGLILLTGPTGHGKTTTLAALVDLLNSETTRHIITVEDPVEYLHPRKKALMSQREVGTHTRSAHSALRAALREDPDVLVVGELRDTETMRLALAASETGHLVIGTMNTPSAVKTIDRVIDLFPPSEQQQVRMTLAGALRLVVSQRLLPSATGASEMAAAVELLPGLPALWNLIRDGKTYQIPSLQQRGRALGIVRLDDSLLELVRAERVAAGAALAIADSPEELEGVLTGHRATLNSIEAPRLDAPPGATAATAAVVAEQAVKQLFDKAGSLFKKKGP